MRLALFCVAAVLSACAAAPTVKPTTPADDAVSAAYDDNLPPGEDVTFNETGVPYTQTERVVPPTDATPNDLRNHRELRNRRAR
ncbi:MAG: hypothetical protein PHT12_01610 [Patescibacteria group bacterium]|nr:hypothetical protein [Patescibacteria group bacterium]